MTSLALFTSLPLLRPPRLHQQTEQLLIIRLGSLHMQVQLKVNEQILIIDLFEVEQANVALLFLVDLHVAVVAHDALVELRSRQSIGLDQVEHVFILKLAHSRLRITEYIDVPWLVKEKLLNAEYTALIVQSVILRALVTEDYELAAGHEEHRFVLGALFDYALTCLKFDRLEGVQDEALVSFFDALEESSHGWILEVEVSQSLVDLSIRDVSHNWIVIDAVHVVVDGLHRLPSRNMHDFKDLQRQKNSH